MNMRWIATVLTGAMLVGAFGAPRLHADDNARAAQARALVKTFAMRLKSELVSALKAGGPEAAIDVCNTEAPAIADELASEKGWMVGRTAIRLRNQANTPDAWERGVLDRFQAAAATGADLAKLEHFEMTNQDGETIFRYMKAIPVQEPCLTCHGKDVSASLRAKIRAVYPEDAATGFSIGELRGAFTISQPIE